MTFKSIILAALALSATIAQAQLPPVQEGDDGAACTAGSKADAALVEITGLKDRTGLMRVEFYPSNKDDFLADHEELIAARKPFRRIVVPLPASGPLRICVKLPAVTTLAVVVIHQRGGTRKFNLSTDGIAFAGNPRLGWTTPAVDKVSVAFTPGITTVPLTMNYRQGLSMRPLPAGK